jgi:tetratricopeptide (TPR) repeat protein/predicted Ser/Thr protein kinase
MNPILCPKCATPNPKVSRFCSTCGGGLHEGGSDEAPTGSGVTRTNEAAGAPSGTLSAGTVLGGRYRILSPLGMGGMGMVYKALDLDLSVPVALKVIRSEYGHNEKILARFKREITIARKVTHKNVARIYDMGEAEGVKYITMEFIEGDDLAKIVERDGALPTEQVTAILKQVCAGLAEAHAQGVVHRDLKPHNVMLGPSGSVHIMDFGIAVSQETRGLTRTFEILGTPEYLSPEQAEGKKVDHRADIYSLGILIYEALTGLVPFSGETQWEVIRKHVQEAPRAPRKLRAEAPPWLETLILKCLEKDPALRYQSVGEILHDIERQKATRSIRAYAPSKRTVSLAAGAVVLTIAAGLTAYFMRPTGLLPGPGGRLSVAVLPFENQAARRDLDWLRTGLAENLSTDLAQSNFFRVLTRERLGRILRDLGHDESDALEREALSGVAEYGGVQAVFSGSFISAGEDLRVNLRAIDPKTGEVIGSAVVPGTASEVLAMIDTLTVHAKEILRISSDEIAADVDTAIADARTSSVEAASLFQQGVDLIYAGRNLEAIEPLEHATRIDPDFALAHARLSEAYRNLGYDEKAREMSQKALSRLVKALDRISLADRAYVRAIHADASEDRQEAIEAYTEMLETDPYDASTAYELGLAYEKSGQWAEAETYYQKALELDENFALAHISLGRIRVKAGRARESLPAFDEALEIYVRMGSKEGEGSANQALCEADISLRQWDEALDRCSQSRSIGEAIGDKRRIAASLSSTAYVFQVTGRLDEALDAARRSLGIRREIGDTYGTATSLTDLTSILHERGDVREAVEACDEAIDQWRAVGDRAWEAELMTMRGALMLGLGDLDGAAGDLDAAAALYEELGIEEGAAQVISNRALLALARGDLNGTEDLLRDALERWERLEIPEGVSETQYRQARVAVRRGLYGTAIRLSGQALKDYRANDDQLNTARCRAVLAEALLRAGDVDGAAREVEAGLETARRLGNPILLAKLEGVRAEIALARGKAEAVREIAASVCSLAAPTDLPPLRFACSLLEGKAALARGNAGAAAASAAEAASRARASGSALAAVEADLLGLRAQAESGADSAAATGLALVARASEHGAHDILARAIPAILGVLAGRGEAERIPPIAALLAESLKIIRDDVPGERLEAFLDESVDLQACRRVVGLLREQGGAAEADRLEQLLRP